MRINAINQQLSTELRKVRSLRKTEKNNSQSKFSRPYSTDLSSNAQNLNKTEPQTKVIETTISAHPEIRLDKIAETKQKIEDGFYNSEEFIDKLADKLLHEFGL